VYDSKKLLAVSASSVTCSRFRTNVTETAYKPSLSNEETPVNMATSSIVLYALSVPQNAIFALLIGTSSDFLNYFINAQY